MHMKRNPGHVLTPACTGAILALSLQGQVAVSNLGEPDAGFGPTVNAGFFEAMSFTTGPGPGWQVASVDLRLYASGSTPGTLSVSLNADSSGQPGAQIAALNTGTTPTSLANYSYTPGGAVTLAASTIYWVVAQGTGIADGYGWVVTNTSTAETGMAGWTIEDWFANSTDGGSTWNVGIPPSKFAVRLVPEPLGCVALTSAALLGLAVGRRCFRAGPPKTQPATPPRPGHAGALCHRGSQLRAGG